LYSSLSPLDLMTDLFYGLSLHGLPAYGCELDRQ